MPPRRKRPELGFDDLKGRAEGMMMPAWRPSMTPRPVTVMRATSPSLSMISPDSVSRLESRLGSWASAPVR
jgi:hypothetical protein